MVTENDGTFQTKLYSMTATWTQEVEVKPKTHALNKPLTMTHIFKIKNKISRSQHWDRMFIKILKTYN